MVCLGLPTLFVDIVAALRTRDQVTANVRATLSRLILSDVLIMKF